MDKQFDELSKSLAEGVSRREVLRKIGYGLAGVLLAVVGLGRGAGSQGSAQCCLWECHANFSNHTARITTCGLTCPDPSTSEMFCNLKSSKTVSDCTKCK